MPATTPRIIQRPGVGASAGILQRQELEFKRLVIDQPVLIVVLQGIKTLRWAHGEYHMRAGEALALAAGQTVDIINRMAPNGAYRAHWLAWDPALIAAHAQHNPAQPVIRHALPIVDAGGEFAQAFQRALHAMEDPGIPVDIARHRVAEMLQWLTLHGGRFEPVETLTSSAKVRRLISQDLAREWAATAVARALAMSEATLRRKLAEEGSCLSDILSDVRLSSALGLLLSTAQPVTQIALSCGYQTPSHFAARFRQRFEFSPSAIRRKGPEKLDLSYSIDS
ncbi:AraC family transcriptional regulator [Rhodoferax sp.]|uniref:AraC family transcriptional regulator n=1 Tax=Rhodoferax sp. TaxID=50421 RepID=UPI0028433814|nr:AraC family transcriptional regulator [Rhodoferax sp.]MDR3371096.1 AraC family transcriptional regulator [Rhodoferax sp.]